MIYKGVLGAFLTRYSIRMYNVQFSIIDLQLKTLLKHRFLLHAYLLSVFATNLMTLVLSLGFIYCHWSLINWKRFDHSL